MASTPYTFISQPGVRRDGTELDSPFYADGVWVRWSRGKPRKMGGYRASSLTANGPVRSVLADSRNGILSNHYFSPWGIQRQQLSNGGAGGDLEDRTPFGFQYNASLTWSHDLMYSSTGGAYSAIIAAATPDVNDISSDVAGNIYTGNVASNAPMTVVSDSNGPITVSGGITVLQPFLVVYGSNGLIRNSNANDYSAATGWTATGGNYSNSANVAGTKIVYGAPTRGGTSSPAGLFWGLSSIIRMSFIGGTTYWNYDTVSTPTAVLSKKAIVEVDGKFYWPGIDRFLYYAGTVQELPNNMSLDYFYDNLNYAYANKVWGTKIKRWGEIWWFYPKGSATECTDAVIFNYRENTWYDAVLKRSAGDKAQTTQFPAWAGSEDGQQSTKLNIGTNLGTSVANTSGSATLTFAAIANVVNGMYVSGDPGIPVGATVASQTTTTITLSAVTTSAVPAGAAITFTTMAKAFAVGTLATGGTSGATGTVVRTTLMDVNVTTVTGTFQISETITNTAGASAKIQQTPVAQQLDAVYQHEFGYDKVVTSNVSAIYSAFTSQNFGFAVGAPFGQVPKTTDILTRITRIEPDFNPTGDLTITVEGRSFAQDPNTVLGTYVVPSTSSFQDMRVQERILRVTVASDCLGGFYEQGQVLCSLEPGDERSTKVI